MNKCFIIILAIVIFLLSHSQLAFGEPALSLCDFFKKSNITDNFSEDINFRLSKCGKITKYAGYPGSSKQLKAEIKLRELPEDGIYISDQQKDLEFENEVKGYDQQKDLEFEKEVKGFLEQGDNYTYPIDGGEVLFWHGYKKNVEEEVEKHLYAVRYETNICKKQVEVTVKCYLGPFRDAKSIANFFKEFDSKLECLK